MTGLAAAEATNPLKSIPMATKQVLWRIAFLYIVLLEEFADAGFAHAVLGEVKWQASRAFQLGSERIDETE